jgi:LemA protein
MKAIKTLLLITLLAILGGCGYNSLQTSDEGVNAAWSEVLNQYQRRADLVPNLVASVKGYAAHEEQVFREVTEARSRVGGIDITIEDLANPELLNQFQQAQGAMGSALSRLIAVAENYPELKADGLFRDLMAQLEGTENRIGVARNRYIAAIQSFNGIVRQFPSNLTAMVFGFATKAQFTVENEAEISTAPSVEF